MNYPKGIPQEYLNRLPLPEPFLNYPADVHRINAEVRKTDPDWPGDWLVVGSNGCGDYWYLDRSEKLWHYDGETGRSSESSYEHN